MEAPKCPHCKKREWRHICADLVVNAAPKSVPSVVNAQVVVNARSKDRHKKVRSEYFREYMRVWRALKSGRALPLR